MFRTLEERDEMALERNKKEEMKKNGSIVLGIE